MVSISIRKWRTGRRLSGQFSLATWGNFSGRPFTLGSLANKPTNIIRFFTSGTCDLCVVNIPYENDSAVLAQCEWMRKGDRMEFNLGRARSEDVSTQRSHCSTPAWSRLKVEEKNMTNARRAHPVQHWWIKPQNAHLKEAWLEFSA